MLDGLHTKLLGKRLAPLLPSWQSRLASPTCNAPGVPGAPPGLFTTPVSRVVTVGKAPFSVPSFHGACPWKSSPFARTVTPAPSNAPISEGSCNCSARLPFREASQPITASSGRRSTCGLLVSADHVEVFQPTSGQLNCPEGSNGCEASSGTPCIVRPNR